MTRAIPQHWLLLAGPADTGLAVRLEPVMSKKGVSLAYTPGPIGERLDIDLKTSENDNAPLTDAYRDLENSARNGGERAYALLQSEDDLRHEATFRFRFEKKYQNSDVLQNVSGASADLLFGLAVVTAVRSDLDYPPFAATGILNEDSQVLGIEGLCAKINAILDIPALCGKGLIFYPKANEDDIDAELRHRVELAQIRLKPVERLEEAVECLGITIKGTWLGNPYRRLDVFEYNHSRIYFGRENETVHLADKLLQREELGRPSLLILGPSGGGKSSLVQAGLIPELERRFRNRSLSLLFSVWDLRDAANKDVHAIAASIRFSWSLLPGLAALAVDSSSNQQATITLENAFTALVRDFASYLPDRTCFVWVLDQLEQFFTLNLSEEAETALIQFLRELQAKGIWVVATFRNDFYSSLQAHDGILSLFDKDGIHDLEKLSETAIERIIQKPAKLAKLEFEYDDKKLELLSLKLKNDALGGGKDILPLLEFALYQLYENRELKNGRNQMTWAAYEAMGGLHGAIGSRANDILNSLDDTAQATLDRVLRALTSPRRDSAQIESGKSPFIARVANVERFPLGTPARRLVDAFAEARLFVRDRDNEGIAQVRVTHEALFTHWPKANEILRGSIKDLELRERLADRIVHWKGENEEPSLLLQAGLPLAEAQDLLARLGDELGEKIIHYIERSSIADQERKQKELQAQRRKTRFVSITAVILGILLIVAAGAGYFAIQRSNELTATLVSSYLSEGARLAENNRPKEALAYLAGAMSLDSRSDTAASRLAASLLLSPKYRVDINSLNIKCQNHIGNAEFNPDGQWILVACDLTAQIWDATSGKPISPPMEHRSIVESAQFSPDGRLVVTASQDGTAQVWEATTGEPVSKPMQHERSIETIQFSPDGRWVVTGSWDGTAKIWEVATGESVSKYMQHTKDTSKCSIYSARKCIVYSAQFSPDGRWIVTASSDNTAQVWEAVSGESVSKSMKHKGSVDSAQFSPDGRWVVTASADGTAQVWEAATGEPMSRPMKHESRVNSAQFSPDGRWIVTASGDGTAQVWEAVSGEPVSKSMQHNKGVNSGIYSAQFSPDGRWVVTASWDDTAQVWEAATGELVSKPRHHSKDYSSRGIVYSAKFSPDGRRLITTSLQNRMVQVWEVAKEVPALQPTILDKVSVNSAQFSPDGCCVVTASRENSTQIWDTATGASVPGHMLHKSSVVSARYSPDGLWVVTASFDQTAQIWKASTGEPVSKPMRHKDGVDSAQFSPDGRWVVTASRDGTAQVWEATTGEPVSKPMQHENAVDSAQFSPDGRWVVTVSSDNTARVWEAISEEPVSKPMKHEDHINSAQFSLDGRWIVTASRDGTAQVWEATTGEPVSKPMKHEGQVNSAQFSPDGRWIVTASWDGTAQVWEAVSGESVSKPMHHKWVVISAQFSPDGRWVITGSQDKTARLWEAVTGDPATMPFEHHDLVSLAQFSPDGHRILTQSDQVRVWEILRLPQISLGFTEFLEQISGYSVISKNLIRTKYKDPTISRLREWAAATTGFTREERAFIDWWLSDPIERTVTPTSKQTVKERVQMLIARDTITSLNEALDYYPGHPMALAKLAAATWRETKTDQQNDIRPRVALWANLALKYAPDDTAVRAVAERILQDIAQPN